MAEDDGEVLGAILGGLGLGALAYLLSRQYCDNCGAANSKNREYCRRCGNYL